MRRKVAMLGAFNTGIWESFMELLFTSCGFPCLTDILYRTANYDCLWRDAKVLGQKYLAQNDFLSITWLTWTLALHYMFFSASRNFYGKSNQTHTHAHTHTHTHTQTHPWYYQIHNYLNVKMWSLVYFSLNEQHENNRKTIHLSIKSWTWKPELGKFGIF